MKKLIINALALSATIGLLASCLEDKGYTDIVDGSNFRPVISVYGGNTDLNMKTVGSAYTADSQDLTLFAVTGANLTTDVTVTLKVAADYVDKYNAKLEEDAIANGDTTAAGEPVFDAYQLYPEEYYTIPSLTVTIPKGTHDIDFKVKVLNSSIIPLADKYLLPFEITSVNGDPNAVIASNLNVILIGMVVKNDYEANYAVTGYLFHPSSMRAIKKTKGLATVNKTTSEGELGDLAGNNYYFRFSVEPDNTLSNWQPAGATPTGAQSGFMYADYPHPAGVNWPPDYTTDPGTGEWVVSTYNNTYDPAKKTFWMHYGYASGGTGEATYTRVIYEKWVRQ